MKTHIGQVLRLEIGKQYLILLQENYNTALHDIVRLLIIDIT